MKTPMGALASKNILIYCLISCKFNIKSFCAKYSLLYYHHIKQKILLFYIFQIHPSHKALYIPYNGAEVAVDEYEIMIFRPPITIN